MTPFYILLALFVLAWATAGFSAAIACLKLRWNLVGGTLLLIVALLPLAGLFEANLQWQTTGTSPLDMLTRAEIHDADETILGASLIGFFLGTLVGLASGLLPHAGAKDDNNKTIITRWAHSWSWWKLLATPPVVVGLVWGLFFLADWSAQGRLKKVLETHREQLQAQEAAAPRQQNDASPAHEALLLALMQDPEPDWIEKHNRAFRPGQPVSPGFQYVDEGNLLRVVLPNFEQAPAAVAFVQRHEAAYETLKQQVLEDGQEYRYWHPKLARFAAVRALVHLRNDDLPAAHADLQLMTHMARQAIDERVGESHDFIQIETYRFLVFQAMLASTDDLPPEVYDTMLADLGDVRLAVRRGLKRGFHEGVVQTIEMLLKAPQADHVKFQHICNAAAVRIVHQHGLESNLEALERDINTHFVPNATTFHPLGIFPFNQSHLDLVASPFINELVRASYFITDHEIRRELVRAVRALQEFHQQQGRYPTQAEFVQLLVTPEWTCSVPLDYITLHDPASGAEIGAAIAHGRHARLTDGLGVYVGPAARRVIHHADTDLVVRMHGGGLSTWIFPQVGNNALKRKVPPIPGAP